ncbi:MAG: transposase [Planctomycetes bacterium]|nr:transposase [Planctomycetota bacterium]
MLAVALPWVICAGQRSVQRLAALGWLRRSASSYYRFLSDGKWRLAILRRSLFELIVRTFRPELLTLVLDDTLCPKYGRKIFGTSAFFDHVKRPRPGFIWGHNWIVLSVVVSAPSGKCPVALPFWIGLYRRKDSCARGQFRTRHQLATQALEAVRDWFPGPVRLLADGAYANQSLMGPARELCMDVVSRLRCDARLRAPEPAKRTVPRPGRRPKFGARLPDLPSMARSRGSFRREVVPMYGKNVTVLVRTLRAYWPAIDQVIQVVITRDPKNPRRVAYLFTTDLFLGATAVISAFAQRWTIEQLFSVAKNQMGLDTAEVRKERAVIRHATLCMALITWVEVWTYRARPAAWDKSFATKLSALRGDIIAQTVFASGPRTDRSRRIAHGLAAIFVHATSAA